MAILHRTRTLPTLMPRYAERFRCIGPACEDTCCASWSIHVDKKAYKAYRQEQSPELGKLLAGNLVRIGADTGTNAYAAFRLVGDEQQCPMTQEGLCSIHKQLGESYLPDVCFSYPRQNNEVAGQFEQSLNLSCPEAARLALLAEDALEFVEGSVAMRESTVAAIESRHGLPLTLMNDVRIFCINLLRTRELALWQRMALLGAFCDALASHCETGRQQAVPALLQEFIGLVESGELLASLSQFQPDVPAQAKVFATLWAEKGFAAPSHFQQAVIRAISARLGANAEGQVDAGTLVAVYIRGLERLEQALAAAPYLLENYLVNEMFGLLFPFNASGAYDGFVVLATRFGLLRLLLAAQCSGEDELPSTADLLAAVHLHCRRFQHDIHYTARIHDALRESGWASLDRMVALLRT
jgi:lysine-N-methylase